MHNNTSSFEVELTTFNMGHLRLLSVAFTFIAYLSISYTVSCASLFVARGDDGLVLAQVLQGKGFDIYGFYGDIVVASPQSTLAQVNDVKELCSEVVELGERGDLEEYYVLERQELFGVEHTEPVRIGGSVSVLYSSFNRVVVSATDKQFLQGVDMEVLPIPHTPIHLGIRDELLPYVKEIYERASLKYTTAPIPAITELVEAVDSEVLRKFVTYLTGEDPTSNILTRNSVSQGAVEASAYIQKQFDSFGLQTSLLPFRADYSSNVLGIKLGVTDSSKIVVIGAHYDSRGTSSTSPTQRAPGANDNGSGTGAVLQIAKVLFDKNATFDFTIHFLAYSGEEQGLYGSAAYAQKLVTENAAIVGALNADMIAYRVSTENTQCAFPSRYSTPALEAIAREAVATYVPELTIGITTACCSDHQSYYNRGFPATGFFERNGAIADPQYHRSEDLVNRAGYDVTGQYTQLTKGVLATLATVAGLRVPPPTV